MPKLQTSRESAVVFKLEFVEEWHCGKFYLSPTTHLLVKWGYRDPVST